MVKVNAAELAEKWARRTSGATADYTRGINKVSIAPGQLAAQKQDKMLQNLTESITSGKWAVRVAGVSLADWKKQATEKGAGRIASGVAGAQQDMQRFAQELIAFEETLQSQIDGMADLTLEDRIQRATAWMRGMAAFSRS